MSVPIVLDKSSFQGLNYNNIIELHRYFRVNITPLLVSEILGDLSKEEKEGRKPPKEDVINLSKKLFPYNSYVNIPYETLVKRSLLGDFTEVDNRPILHAVQSIDGEKKGLIFQETKEELSIKRWKKGEFDKIDEISSDLWRQESKDENVIENFKSKFEHLKDIKVSNRKASKPDQLEELKEKLFERLNIDLEPEDTIKIICEYFEVNEDKQQEILSRWKKEKFAEIEDFAEYAYYCYLVVSMFFIGLNNNLFGDRLTNLLDLEYLFYAPFSLVFSSNDKFLIELYNIIRPKNVTFISLKSLKEDLKKFEDLNKGKEKFSKYPPDKNTETYKIWDKNFDIELSKKLEPSEKEIEKKKKELEEILKIAETGKKGKFQGEPDFHVKESYMSPDDPCPCGSGKPLGECHLKQ